MKVELVVQRVATGKTNEIAFRIRDIDKFALRSLFATGNAFRLTIEPPFKKRSTGEYSQNAHGNGHCMQIAKETGNSFDAVKMESKKMAAEHGKWRWETLPNGSIYPASESGASTEEATEWIECLHQLAAELGIILKEH